MSQNKLLPSGTVKYRENSADSVVFHLKGHTAQAPRTMTITRELPTPRKGNLGTMKLKINVHMPVDIGTETVPNITPSVVKVETSVPVGAHSSALQTAFRAISAMMFSDYENGDASQPVSNLFLYGLLPDGTDGTWNVDDWNYDLLTGEKVETTINLPT